MHIARILRHLVYPDWLARRTFPAASLARIESAIADSETRHTGEIRFVVEASLGLLPLLRGQSARERAVAVFSEIAVWDTEDNNGVLIYLLLADRDVEIVADRGVARRVPRERWEEICREMERCFRAGRYEEGVIHGVDAIGRLLEDLYPGGSGNPNELPDRPLRF